MNNPKEGDIFRWEWADESKRRDYGPFGSYHCKSCIAIFKGGSLYDTFWGSCPTANSYLSPNDVSLTFLGNKNELEKLKDTEEFYDPSDLVVMRHSNDSRAPTLVRPGAKRSPEIMQALVERKRFEARQKVQSAISDLEHLSTLAQRISDGDVDRLFF